MVVDRGDGIIIQRELKGERGVIVARQQFTDRLFADGQAADAAVCGLEGQGAGVRIDGCDENHVQIRFVPMGVPAGGFRVVIPAGNEIIAVRFAVQLPAAAGGAKGNGGIPTVLDVVTAFFCMVVVQLHVIRKSCSGVVSETAAIPSGSGVITNTA